MRKDSEEIVRAYRHAVYAVDQAFDEALAALEAHKAGFNTNQPRVPAGSSDGGQWTAVGGGGGSIGGQPAGGRFRQQPARTEKDPDAIEPVYLLESILPGLAPVRRLYHAWRVWNVAESEWTLGPHKSPTKWANQLRERNWTPEQITEALAKGKRYPAENRVSPENKAIRYVHPTTGRSLVQDDVNKRILQVGDDGFLH